MKITAHNLRSIGTPFTIDVDDKIALIGGNGAGKSTVVQVPYFVMTGKELSVKNGEQEGYGTISFNGIEITRYKSNGGCAIKFNGKACSEKAMYEELNKRGYNPDVLCSLFDTETKLDGETMLKVAAMKLSIDKILSFTSLKDKALDLVKDYFATNDIDIITIPVIDKTYKKFYTTRTDVNRRVKELKVLLDRDIDNASIDIPDLNDMVNKTSEIEEEIAQLVSKKYETQKNNEAVEKVKKEIKDISDNLNELKKEKITYTQDDIKKMDEKIEECQTRSKTLLEEHHDANAALTKLNELLTYWKCQMSSMEKDVENKQNTVKTLTENSVCPLYAGMPCTTDKSAIISDLNEKINSLSEEVTKVRDIDIKGLEKEISETKDDIAKILKNQNECADEIASLNKQKSQMHEEIRRFTTICSNIEMFNKLLSEKEASIAKMSLMDETALDSIIEAKKQELATIKERIVSFSVISESKKRYEENFKKYEENSELSSCYTTILNELQTLPNKIFEKIITPIESGLNNVLSNLKPDWSIKFQFDKSGITIHVTTPNGKVDIEELSTGEKIIINYMFKVLICDMINFDTLILDNTDALDEDNYATVEEVVMKSPYNTLLVNCGEVKTKLKVIKK